MLRKASFQLSIAPHCHDIAFSVLLSFPCYGRYGCLLFSWNPPRCLILSPHFFHSNKSPRPHCPIAPTHFKATLQCKLSTSFSVIFSPFIHLINTMTTDYRKMNICPTPGVVALSDHNTSMMDFLFMNSTDPGSSASCTTDSPAKSNEETLQNRLLDLINGARESWTYAIFWQTTPVEFVRPSMLTWGDGYYKGEEDKEKRKKASSSSTSVAEQEHRKRILRELDSLIAGAQVSGDDAVDEEVTDTEWFFLISMTQTYVNGSGLPGQALYSSNPIWVTGGERLTNSPCERARQAQVYGLQTMVCIPLANGVVELGSTDLIFQNSDLMNKVFAICGNSRLEDMLY